MIVFCKRIIVHVRDRACCLAEFEASGDFHQFMDEFRADIGFICGVVGASGVDDDRKRSLQDTLKDIQTKFLGLKAGVSSDLRAAAYFQTKRDISDFAEALRTCREIRAIRILQRLEGASDDCLPGMVDRIARVAFSLKAAAQNDLAGIYRSVQDVVLEDLVAARLRSSHNNKAWEVHHAQAESIMVVVTDFLEALRLRGRDNGSTPSTEQRHARMHHPRTAKRFEYPHQRRVGYGVGSKR